MPDVCIYNFTESILKYGSTETGVIYETTELIKSAKSTVNSFSNGNADTINHQDLRDVSIASKEMMLSIKDLMNEITVTFASSKKSTTFRNVRDIVKDGHDIYKTTTV